MEGSGRPAGSRSTSDSRTPTSTPLEQPKRQAPDKRKPPDKTFDKRKDAEREIRSRGRRPYKSAPKEVRDTTPKYIVIPETINVQDLASKMSRKASELIMKLMGLGVMATINQELDAETATILANDMGVTVEIKAEKSLAVIEEIIDDPKDLKSRPPVVTVMGHVDHGKTSLLDAIRTTNVIDSEAGGITQHIGAYQVEIKGQKITFLDTPGHEAFTSMRARGAQVTDIAVLVVAADDGVMPQTVEAINHAKAAAVPIIVAVNKIDKEDAKPDKVKQELTEHGLVVEEWGGETIAVPVSAKAKTNIEQLLEMILLVAEVKELKANPNRPAMGTVIEAKLDKGKGPVATVLVAKGTLNVGDVILAGTFFGRVRAMVDDKGRRLKKATPSMPVEIQGISEVPAAGELFYVIADEKLARQITSARSAEKRLEDAKQTAKISLEDLFERINQGEVKDLNIIIKADVQGSVEALQQSLLRLSTDEVRVNPIHGGVGAITETDVMLAAASNAIIIGFNVRPGSNTKATAEIQGVDIRLYRVIYDAIEDVKAAMTGLLDPDYKEVVLGSAEVRQVFKVPKIGSVAGCHVVENKIIRSAKVRVIRDGVVIHEGNIDSLRRFKDDVREVTEGYECGIGIERFNDIKEGDKIEAFIIEEVKRQSL
jgi:translation initiation factor IF-2